VSPWSPDFPPLESDGRPQARFQFPFEFGIALGLRCLPLERIDLARDLFQNVVHARQILLGALQFGLGQPFARLETRDAGGFFNHRAAVLWF